MTSGKSEASQCPVIMCTLITAMLNPLWCHQLSLFIGIQTVTAVSHWQSFSLTWLEVVLEVDPVLCLDSAISLSKPNKSPQCDHYQVLSGCKNSKLQIYSFCKGTRLQAKKTFLLFMCFQGISKKLWFKIPFKIIWKQLRSSQIEQNFKLPTLFFSNSEDLTRQISPGAYRTSSHPSWVTCC